MSDWKLIVEPGAKNDIREAFKFYSERAGEKVAVRFREAVRGGMRTVHGAPERWATFDEHGARAYLLNKFPYAIVYDVEDEFIVVLAVMHEKRSPEYYRG